MSAVGAVEVRGAVDQLEEFTPEDALVVERGRGRVGGAGGLGWPAGGEEPIRMAARGAPVIPLRIRG